MHLLAREEAGLRCLLHVATRSAGGRPVPIAKIAAHEGISGVYAAKLMRQLRLAGLVESTRGAAGGYQLSRPAESISVWDAIGALDENFIPGTHCDCAAPERGDCRRKPSCAVSSLWRTLGNDIRRTLEAVSLASLCEGQNREGLGHERLGEAPTFKRSLQTTDSLATETNDLTSTLERSSRWSHSN